jgi:protein ImuB
MEQEKEFKNRDRTDNADKNGDSAMFAGVYAENFLVQAVVRGEPELKKCALAVVEGVPPLTKVVAVNKAARRAGIEIGMPKSTVVQFVGVGIRVRSLSLERSAHAAMLDLGWSISPRIEDTAADTMVVDIAGLGPVWGTEAKIAREIVERGNACGLRLNVTIATNIGTALTAARGTTGACVIAPGAEAARLSGLPVSVLNLTEETAETLERWGVRTCGALAALPLLELSERLGQEGVRLHEQARGDGQRALVAAEAAHTFVEEMELEDSVEELEPLSFLLGRLLDQLCARLTARVLAASAIQMQFELEPPFDKAIDTKHELVRGKNLPGIFECELQLPVPMNDPKILLKLVRLRLQAHPPTAGITKIRMKVLAGRRRTTQNGLFLPSFPDTEKLELTLARIENVVGEGNVGVAEQLDTHRSGAFLMKKFLRTERDENKRPENIFDEPAALSCRIFRPPLAAKVELDNDRPAHLFFSGLRGEIVTAAGPWKTSGEWWREDAWWQEEWDFEIQFRQGKDRIDRGLYRVYYDAKCDGWFVRGIYD